MVMMAAPSAEPVTLTEAKVHCRVDGAAENDFIASLIVTSRLQIETALDLALVTQSWRLTLDGWPKNAIVELPMWPAQSITSIDVAIPGRTISLPSTAWHLDGHARPPRVIMTEGLLPWPVTRAEGIAITFVAGFGSSAADVPAPIRHALLMLVAHWFEHREPVTSAAATAPIPVIVSELLTPFRQVRL